MRIALCQTIPLSEETREAWKSHGAIIYKRERSLDQVIQLARRVEAQLVLNYGSRSLVQTVHDPLFLWNPPDVIRTFNHPGSLRENFDDLLPPRPSEYPALVWLKAPGQKGQGKHQIQVHGALDRLPNDWDWQQHVEGQEYRVITVGHRMVQGFRREGTNNAREYQWTGLRDTPSVAKDLARTAARRLNAPTVIAWDIIIDESGRPFILEGNSSPGISGPTAGRIVRELERQLSESR